MKRFLVAATLALATPVMADDVTDALDNALTAYEDGDIQYALEELGYAQQLLKAMKADSLESFLPAAPDGWTRSLNPDFVTGLGMMGGGVGVQADYTGPGGASMQVMLMADNPMVASLGPMIANAAMMGGKIVRVGREKFVLQNDELSGLIGNRVLVQASGSDRETVVGLLESMDFRALANFGN